MGKYLPPVAISAESFRRTWVKSDESVMMYKKLSSYIIVFPANRSSRTQDVRARIIFWGRINQSDEK